MCTVVGKTVIQQFGHICKALIFSGIQGNSDQFRIASFRAAAKAEACRLAGPGLHSGNAVVYTKARIGRLQFSFFRQIRCRDLVMCRRHQLAEGWIFHSFPRHHGNIIRCRPVVLLSIRIQAIRIVECGIFCSALLCSLVHHFCKGIEIPAYCNSKHLGSIIRRV